MTDSKKPKSIGIISIATNNYEMYWKAMTKTLIKSINDEFEYKLYLFTDARDINVAFLGIKSNIKVELIYIEKLTWPLATLLRYKIIVEHAALFNEELLMYIDADMLINRDFMKYIDFSKLPCMYLVHHPGYWRPRNFYGLPIKVEQLKIYLTDLKIFVLKGALGAWETRKKFAAFVPRELREVYVCGGVWLGSRNIFIKMCSELDSNIKKDLESGRIAKWHDESHLNYWSSHNDYCLLSPAFCFYPKFKYLKSLPNYIEAIDKTEFIALFDD